MRHAAWLLLALLLSGCAAETRGAVRSVPYGESAPATSACEAACSHEWWNLTLAAEGPFRLAAPLPVIHADLHTHMREPWSDPAGWNRAFDVEGDARARVDVEAGAARLVVEGTGPAEVRAHRIREAGPSGYAEDFLLARWGPEANQTRPSALPVHLEGRASELVVTYAAAGGLCERAARYAAADLDAGASWLPGQDQGACT